MSKEMNGFRIVKYRLKIGTPNVLLVQGWFSNNDQEENDLIFLLDNKRLIAKRSIREGIEVRKKYLDSSYGIDKEYYFWIPLPNTINVKDCLRIFEKQGEKQKLIYAIPASKILKLRKKIDKYVDEPKITDEKIQIDGWYIEEDIPVEIKVLGENGKELPFEAKSTYRKDVVVEYPDVVGEEVKGFSLELKNNNEKKMTVVLSAGEKNAKYQCDIKPSKVKKGFTKIWKLQGKTIRYLKNNGLKKTVRRAIVKTFKVDENNYKNWTKKHKLTEQELQEQREQVFAYAPKISIVIPLYKTPLNYLDELVSSIQRQTYSNWEICFSDGSGEQVSELTKALQKYAESNKNIRYVVSEQQLRISENTNKAIEIATGDFIAFADHDDLLTEDALYECVKALNENREIDVIYSDEDKISMDGKELFEPHFKTDFNINLLCSMNYFCHLVVVNKTIISQIGMLRSDFDGAQDYDFVLRAVEVAKCVHHIPRVLYHWRAHKDSTAENPQSKMYAFEAGKRAVQAHYDRIGVLAKVHQGEYLGLYKTEHILQEKPMISILIPNKDHIQDLDKCIRAIEVKSKYENYEYIIIENNSESEETFQYYKDLEKENPRVKVVYWDKEFNYSAINNYGVTFAKGEYLLLLNNDTEIINGTCLEELVGYCMHDNVGAVGARLYYEDDTIQHAGVIVGFGGIAGHAFIGLPRSANGYFSRIVCAQDMSAVTAACMMVKRSVFEEVGGLDESFKVAFNDIDFCMKIREKGYLIVYNPYAELYHYESKSRGLEDTKEKIERFNGEIARFAQKWPEILKNGDPYYNPNLSIERCDFGLK